MERMERERITDRPRMDSADLPRTIERERFDAYDAITARIIQRIETGVVPWQSPSIARVGFPRNFSTGKCYSGINVFLLGSQEFQSPLFLTFIQAHELGGNVRKGEKGFSVIKVGTWSKEGEQATAPGEGQEPEKRKFLKLYTVFNACQIERAGKTVGYRCRLGSSDFAASAHSAEFGHKTGSSEGWWFSSSPRFFPLSDRGVKDGPRKMLRPRAGQDQ
jgi:hypothetical protein